MDRRKYVNYVTLHRTHKMFIEPCIDAHLTVDMFLGNHDVYYKSTNETNSPSFILEDKPNFTVWKQPGVKEYEGLPIAFLPWMNQENYVEWMQFVTTVQADILCAHLELSGFDIQMGLTCHDGLSPDTFGQFDMVISGHFHHRSQKGNIHYLGVPYQMTWHDFNDPKGFHVFDTNTRKLEFIVNPFSMFEKIYYDDTKTNYATMDKSKLEIYRDKWIKLIVVKKTNPVVYDIFVDRLFEVHPLDLSIIEDTIDLNSPNLDNVSNYSKSTLEMIETYINGCNTLYDKDKLFGIIKSLYLEASYE